MKIFCIGRNYANHAKELDNPVPKQPLVFCKLPTALVKQNKPFYYPEFSQDIHHEVELVLKICKNGKHISEKFACNYYEDITIGLDFTARDVQQKCKDKGHPWEIAKAFDNSAPIGDFISINELGTGMDDISFSLQKNGQTVQQGNTKDLLFSFDKLIVHLSKYFTLQKGDLIFTGTPEGVGPINIGDQLDAFIGEKHLLTCRVK